MSKMSKIQKLQYFYKFELKSTIFVLFKLDT